MRSFSASTSTLKSKMTEISRYPALRSGYAEKKESRPSVALVDNFREGSGIAHGQITESVLILHGGLRDEDIQRLHGESGAPFDPQLLLDCPKDEFVEAFDAFTVGATASFLNMVSDNLDLVSAELPSVRVLNQSQSQTPARLVEPFLQPIFDQPEFRSRLAEALELAPQAEAKQVVTSLLAHTEVTLASNPELFEAKERYAQSSKDAFEQGLVNVIAGGNQGAFATKLSELGVETTPNAFRSVLLNNYVTVVGAATADGKIASLNSPNAGVEVYALGENVQFSVNGQNLAANGTSVAAPLVSGRAAQLVAQHPQWTAQEVEGALLAG